MSPELNACSNILNRVEIVSKNKNLEKRNDNTNLRKYSENFPDRPTTEGTCQSKDDSFTSSSDPSVSPTSSLTDESYPDFGFRVVKHGRSKSNFVSHFNAEAPAEG